MAWKALKRLGLLLLGVWVAFWLFRLPGFTPPTATAIGSAIGSLDGLSDEDRRAFSPEGFVPLGKPRPGDWLSVFPEPGQGFDRYRAARPNRLAAPRTVIALLPLWEFDAGRSPSLPALQAFTAAFFQAGVRLLPAQAPPPGEFHPRRNPQSGQIQFLTTDLLAFLKPQVGTDVHSLVGVTMQDLYPDPSWNFVFGEATLSDRVGIFSFARYAPGFSGNPGRTGWQDLLLRRSCKVLAHETGHMFGLLHCVFFECVMNGSNHLGESDARPMFLCPVCLRKLQHAAGFDIRARYVALAGFYKQVGFTSEADWIDRRLAFIAGTASPTAWPSPAPPPASSP
ncbi:MAG: hypothetical protein GX442_05495 [Candidatus Riflebacteria bacterium]|nr:hypothetical protein [Candidatus Riflebacteria bacterium]